MNKREIYHIAASAEQGGFDPEEAIVCGCKICTNLLEATRRIRIRERELLDKQRNTKGKG